MNPVLVESRERLGPNQKEPDPEVPSPGSVHLALSATSISLKSAKTLNLGLKSKRLAIVLQTTHGVNYNANKLKN